MKNTSSHLLLGAVGLLTVNGHLPANHSTVSANSEPNMAILNATSLKSIESAWLLVPSMCKARGFNADPTPQISKEARESIKAIYASYEA